MNLDGYVPVSERLRLGLAAFPDLRVVELPHQLVELPDGRYAFLCVVEVYRSPDDPLPARGSVLEGYPGSTPFSRGSELMVGMTSALGRALGYLGLGLEHGIASRDEIAAARDRDRERPPERKPEPERPLIRPPSEKMLKLLREMLDERSIVLSPDEERDTLTHFDRCQEMLEHLKTLPKVRR